MTPTSGLPGRPNVADVAADDRALDAIGRGEHIDSDAVLALLSTARADSEANIPAPPLVADLLGATTSAPASSISEGSAEPDSGSAAPTPLKRHRLIRRSASAAAAGGASLTAIFIAGGVAAALAVGGLGVAAYNAGELPFKPKQSETGAAPGSSATSTSGTQAGGSTERPAGGVATEQSGDNGAADQHRAEEPSPNGPSKNAQSPQDPKADKQHVDLNGLLGYIDGALRAPSDQATASPSPSTGTATGDSTGATTPAEGGTTAPSTGVPRDNDGDAPTITIPTGTEHREPQPTKAPTVSPSASPTATAQTVQSQSAIPGISNTGTAAVAAQAAIAHPSADTAALGS
ncbi:hypothetical protein [Corynebacterium heidelbergense]|uniref:Uncharacterized protein n=1 Tax=Corynebacterium heidelbergense TaxID=2055947 RepID=A0A364V641_9CORY|nr:hypothetical protein [Corynebacterium heidelbergense]RAV32120.1 hypothetical protein DLJ54_04770 [Corynebacterium heidelbergense]